MRRVLVTGGAGFLGSHLCLHLVDRHPDWEVIALDNLMRRGSHLNLARLRSAGVNFVHGDVRVAADVMGLGGIEAIVECSAEPSALAGVNGSPEYVVQTNLVGAWHCLELARREQAQLIFMSTSRVYPYGKLDALPYRETETRFELDGLRGIGEDFPLAGPRTLYGASKLATELLITEYGASYDVCTVIDRCGVIAGPWQMGKVDQGVFTYWALAHQHGWPLSYIGYGGKGKQVRDLLHVEDLARLVDEQLAAPHHWAGTTVNVGGGRDVSLSLVEASALCSEITGNEIEISAADEDRPGDVRIYLSDCSLLFSMTDWRAQRDARSILEETVRWLREHEELLPSLGETPGWSLNNLA